MVSRIDGIKNEEEMYMAISKEEALYSYMNWAEIEAIVYSEHQNPHQFLGAHKIEKGIIFQTFMPSAKEISVKILKTGKIYPMVLQDEAGFFAVCIPGKKIEEYRYMVTYDNNTESEICDPYSFDPYIDSVDIERFASGIHYEIYNKLGAHPMTLQGVKGVLFAVWAPNAMRVSVVGDFNQWDGRRHLMRNLNNSGIFELFIPDLLEGEIYKFELKVKGGLVILKSDPYANYAELRPNNASKIWDLSNYTWNDQPWMNARKKWDYKKEPISIYELHLGSWKKPVLELSDTTVSVELDIGSKEFYNYKELAPMLVEYVKEMGYTHVELMPIMEHPFDGSWGYQVTGYYAATARYGTPQDFMYFIDYLHQHEIGVILDWVPAHFPRDAFGLANFDGTCLYEHQDPRQGSHPHWGTLIYNYGRPQVSNFLIANAMFWVDKYHVDGIRMDAVASMLYLDYGKNHGEWVANIYGSNENLEAIEFFKHLNSVFKKRKDGAIIIAEESTAWPKITGDLDENGLGFDLKWNMGWMNDFTGYMKCDPLFRKGRHGELTFSMIYAYSEKFMLVFSHDEVVHGKGSMINKMPGDLDAKFANLKVAYGYMMAHPGKKLLFMGQDFAQFSEWNEKKALDWELLLEDRNQSLNLYVKDLHRLYKTYPALYQLDFSSDGFEWVSCMNADHSMITFVRNSSKKGESLFIVCNFTPVVYENFPLGVLVPGKYKEIFNSDHLVYGGGGNVNPRLKQSKKEEVDGLEDSIKIKVPPLGISVFTITPEVKLLEKNPKEQKTKRKKM